MLTLVTLVTMVTLVTLAGVSDYTVGIRARDGHMSFVDAQQESCGLARFMNHCGGHPNVARRTQFDTGAST